MCCLLWGCDVKNVRWTFDGETENKWQKTEMFITFLIWIIGVLIATYQTATIITIARITVIQHTVFALKTIGGRCPVLLFFFIV